VIATGGTIVAVASAASAGARGAVRLSGPEALAAAEACCGSCLEVGVRRVVVKVSLGEVPAIALVARAPASFTGEDSVEFTTVGHPAVLDAIVIALLARDGVRRAGPGEFTARAFLAGRIDLLEAEAIAMAVSSEGEAEVAAARTFARGGLGTSARSGADALADVLAGIEAGIDFTDEEDVVPVPPERLRQALDAVEEIVRHELAPRAARAAGRGRIPLVVLAGPANAGKSSLFNALLGRERAVTAPVRGTTRDAIVEELHLTAGERSVRIALADVAGDDDAIDPLAAAASRRREELLAAADLIIRCVPPGEPRPEAEARSIVVETKADLADRPSGAVATSARTGAGLAALHELIAARAAAIAPRESSLDAILHRHVDALERTLVAIGRARELAPAVRRQPELVAAAVSEAINPLRELTGVGAPDEVLGRIFARFCIGK
jgi:tRNA modification GTPase